MLSQKKLAEYQEVEANGQSLLKSYLKQDYIAIFVFYLRQMEYHYNRWNLSRRRNVYHLGLYVFHHTMWKRWSLKTGISLAKNVADKGLSIMHYGSIVVNGACRLGRNCCLVNNINIGANGGSDKAPQIGDNVYIGPGAVLFGDITIADGCYIGANAVVTKSCLEENAVLVGAPAKVVKYDPVCWWEKNGCKREK